MNPKTLQPLLFSAALLMGGTARAETVVEMHALSADGVGEPIGTVTLSEQEGSLLLTPDLRNLAPPGPHGFHVHQNPDCGPAEKDGKMVAGLAAGGHFDPEDTGSHQGPHGEGHLGDLPVLEVAEDGTATEPVLAPRLTLDAVRGRALMIHEGGDNYSDEPKPLGGGGGRIACGVIQ